MQIARYCKAYPSKRFQEFPGWVPRETPQSAPKDTDSDADKAPTDEYLFLQDSYVVTRGIGSDEEIVFDKISPEWIEFCRVTMGFAVPDDLVDESSPASSDSSSPASASA